MRKPIERKRRDGRALLLNGARQLLAEKGYAGMELRDVAERGKAPRGSIYHHFPGGKRSSRARRPSSRATTIRDLIERSLEERGLKRDADRFRRDLPPPRRRPPGADRLPGRRRRPRPPRRPRARRRRDRRLPELGRPIAAALRDEGVGAKDAEAFAGLVVSTVEGALLRARAAGSQEPLDSAIAGLGQALDRLLEGSPASP